MQCAKEKTIDSVRSLEFRPHTQNKKNVVVVIHWCSHLTPLLQHLYIFCVWCSVQQARTAAHLTMSE